MYELVVRRFFATVAESATWEHLRVVADAGGRSLKANGKRLVEPGYHEVYPYSSASENHVPDVEEGEELAISEVRIEEKQTQPPRRYGQSRLIETMEKMGIGTKATRQRRISALERRYRAQTANRNGNDGQVVQWLSNDRYSPIMRHRRWFVDEATERVSELDSTLVSERR